MIKINNSFWSKRFILVLAGTFATAIGIIALLDYNGTTSLLFNKSGSNSENDAAKTTSKVPSAQPDFTSTTDNPDKSAAPRNNSDTGQATVNDTGGQASNSTASPKISSTGEVTLYSPLDGALVSSEQEISGTSTLSQVSYRIIDNVSGVIGSGTLSVVNGKFSGTVSISTTAREGRIDIYGVRDDLTEFSSIEIPVRFK